MQYKEREMTIPVIKLYSSRRLSFVGMNTVLSIFVNSKSRWDTCKPYQDSSAT